MTASAPEIPQKKRSSRKGAILLMTLGLLAIMVIFMFSFLQYAHREIRYTGVSGNDPSLRNAAYSVLEISLASILEIKMIEEQLSHPAQGWRDPWQYAQVEMDSELQITTTVTDESGKIPLGKADFELLRFFFEESGIPMQETESLADALLDWIDADDDRRFNGAEENEYADADPPYAPPNAMLHSYEELLLIMGFAKWFTDENGIPNERFTKFRNSFSLYAYNQTNINTLSTDLVSTLERLYNFDSIGWKQLKDGLDGEAMTPDDQPISENQIGQLISTEDISSGFLGTTSEVFQLKVLVSRGEMNFAIECVFSLQAGENAANAYSVNFLHFRENSFF